MHGSPGYWVHWLSVPFPVAGSLEFTDLPVNDRQRMRRSMERILDWDFDQIVVGHGAVVTEKGKEAFCAAFQWLLK